MIAPGYDKDIEIDSDVWIGANATILKGVTNCITEKNYNTRLNIIKL